MSKGSRNIALAVAAVAVVAAIYFLVLPRFFSSGISPEALIAARENARILQRYLHAFAADAKDGLYPVGTHDYQEIQAFFPALSFPEDPAEGGWAPGTFRYESQDGRTYTVKVSVDSPSRRVITITPLGIGMTDTAVHGALKRGDHWNYIEPKE